MGVCGFRASPRNPQLLALGGAHRVSGLCCCWHRVRVSAGILQPGLPRPWEQLGEDGASRQGLETPFIQGDSGFWRAVGTKLIAELVFTVSWQR